MRPAQLLSSIALFSALSSASAPWSPSFHLKAIREINDFVFPRQDSSAADSTVAASSTADASSAKSTAESTAKSTAKSSDKDASSDKSAASTTGSDKSAAASSGASSTGDSSDASTTAKSTGSSGKSSGSDKATSTNKSSKSKTYGVSAGYGGIAMITPNVYSSSSYYKVGEYVTFAWNMTSLSVTPTAIDVFATCTANQNLYTLTANMTVNGSIGAVTWDTGDYQASATVPLLTETYTLIIMDAAMPALTATAAYGGLSVYSAHRFGMYTTQAYTDSQNSVPTCITCKSAATPSSSLERQTLGFVFGMFFVTIASFSLFAGNFGVF